MKRKEFFGWLDFMAGSGFWVKVTLKKTPENMALLRELIKKHRRIINHVDY